MDNDIDNLSESLDNINLSSRSEPLNSRRVSSQSRPTGLLPTPRRRVKLVTTLKAPTAKRISFFDLPNEIRNMIYHYALVNNHLIYVPNYRAYHGTPLSYTEPALLSTHPIIRSQASQIYYSNNTFQTSSTDCARKFLDSLSPKDISILRDFRVFDPSLMPSDRQSNRSPIFKHLNLIAFEGKGALSPDALLIPVHTRSGNWFGWFKLQEMANYEIVTGKGDGDWTVKSTRRHDSTCHSSVKCLECVSRLVHGPLGMLADGTLGYL